MAKPASARPQVLRYPAGDRYFVAVALAILAAVFLIFAGLAGFLFVQLDLGWAAFFTAFALLFALMILTVWREVVGRWTARIAIDDGTIVLHLPRRRGYVPAEPVRRTIPVAKIKRIERRREMFRTVGATSGQDAYALVLDDGSRLVLGADRPMVAPFFTHAARAIAAAAGLEIQDLGTVDARTGFMLLWGRAAPPWDTAPLPPDLSARRRRQEVRSWNVVWYLVLIAALIGVLARVL